ncbi:MAG: phosphoribosylglycinamide formyltransferase [Bacteroidales bacterium]|nr:phosphoribosylglycinamide formyltransferase [Bacteroidales bacterium]
MKKIAIFASGSGTNFQQICEYFQNNNQVKVDVLIVNKKNAYVRQRATNLGIEDFYFDRADFYESAKVLELLQARNIDLIVLAGFLWLIPQNLITAFPNKIINIHPALLPLYGGKGMYGHNVHQAVIAAREKESGITIHYVNELYDSGDIIFQTKCQLTEEDTVESLEEKIHLLEKEHYPRVIASIL